MIKILFICLGNICRSPIAEGVFRDLIVKRNLSDAFEIASASTGTYHTGEHPDPRAVRAAAKVGIDISKHVARQVTSKDFRDYDFVLGMDAENMHNLALKRPEGAKATVRLFASYARPEIDEIIEDPWYRDAAAFDETVRLCQIASEAFLKHLISMKKL
ncbi:MAG TPA: hypothetical protein DCW60_01365 [Sutterella sp.]|nr:hypothetical protein [Sutterella sp.]